ncbi:MAG: BON domain-containing protein [Planctomycetota bacterium]
MSRAGRWARPGLAAPAPGAALLLAACGWYRSPEDSAEMTSEIQDRNIATKVRLSLNGDPLTAPWSETIEVTCHTGIVSLRGAVARDDVRRRAVELAWAAHRGVRNVRDLTTARSG